VAGYQIADEPTPGTLAKFAVNPIFPFLAIMFGGVWIAWPWLAFNGIAIGSPTLRKELAWLGFGLLGLFVLAVGLLYLIGTGTLEGVAIQYAILCLTVGKLAAVYAVYVMQSHTIQIYEYYGGVLRSGIIVIVVLLFVDRSLLFESMPALFALVLA
jgi:hypothetical protein